MKDYMVVVQYTDIQNKKNINRSDLSLILDSLPIDYYAFILHDSDFNDDLTQKTLHYHIVIRFSNSVASSRVIGLLARCLMVSKNVISVLPCKDIITSVRYLCHLDSNKYRYPITEVLTNDRMRTNAILLGEYDSPLLDVFRPIDIDFIVSLVDSSARLRDVYSVLGLDVSREYAYLISTLWKDKK